MDLRHNFIGWALSRDQLHGRMSFISGPRQIGKTTAIQGFLKSLGLEKLYYNWDTQTIKKRFALNSAFFIEDLPAELPRVWVALDEIHKYPKWKNLLKGYYDEWKSRIDFIVSGSARLDYFRQSGDSLVGRYFHYKMLPLGVKEVLVIPYRPEDCWSPERELLSIPLPDLGIFSAAQSLLEIGGFPEPFSVNTREFSNRWRENYVSLIIHEDLRDLTKITHIKKLETLLYLLPEKIGGPLSLNSLRQSLESAHGSISAWLSALKKVYLIFSVPPWSARLARALRKEEKYYFWDWGIVTGKGERFENFIAVQLERAVAAWNEWGRGSFKLFYYRTKDGEEVDFVIADRQKVYLLIEVKAGEENLSPSLGRLQQATDARLAIQVVNKSGICAQKSKGLWIMGVDRLLTILP